MLFTGKNFEFSDFTWKKIFLLQEMVEGGGGGGRGSVTFSTALQKVLSLLDWGEGGW